MLCITGIQSSTDYLDGIFIRQSWEGARQLFFFKCINISDDRRKYLEKIFEVLGIQLVSTLF
jgi:hypothetical protein